MLDMIAERLQSFSPEELKELDSLVQPRLAQLLMKVMPELEPLLSFLIQNDLSGSDPAAPIQGGMQVGMPQPQVMQPPGMKPPVAQSPNPLRRIGA